MATLRAWGVQVPGVISAEHTYVSAHDDPAEGSPPIETWSCFGRHTGGRLLAEVVEADIEAARRAAEPNGTAGIRYAVTGVNHQAANRILFAGGRASGHVCLVHNAVGYRTSAFIWGSYGRPPWDWLDRAKLDTSDDSAQSLNELAKSSPPSLYQSEEPPPQVIEAVSTISAELVSHLKRYPDALHKVSPRQFEELIAELLSGFGWAVELTPTSKDGGYDMYAISKDISGLQSHWIVECKKFAPHRKVEVDIVRSLHGTMSHLGVGNALLVTTSHFTKGSMAFKASRYDLELKDYHDILNWIDDYKLHPGGTLYVRHNHLVLPRRE